MGVVVVNCKGVKKEASSLVSLEKVTLKKDDVVTKEEYADSPDIESLVEEPKPKTEMQLLKDEATKLGIEFKGNISKEELSKLVEEAKA